MALSIKTYTHEELRGDAEAWDFYHGVGKRIFDEGVENRINEIHDGALQDVQEIYYFIISLNKTRIGASAAYIGATTFENEPISLGCVSGTFILEEYRKRGYGIKITNKARKYLEDKVDIIFGYGKRGRRDKFIDLPYYVYKGISGRIYVSTDGHAARALRKDIFKKIQAGSILYLENGRK